MKKQIFISKYFVIQNNDQAAGENAAAKKSESSEPYHGE